MIDYNLSFNDEFDNWNIDLNIHHTTPFLDHSYCAEKFTKIDKFRL